MEYESALRRPRHVGPHGDFSSVFSDFSADQMYPFQHRFAMLGLVTGAVASIYWGSLLAGFAFLVLFLCIGVTWRRNEPPILAFCLSYQWFFVMAGYLYGSKTGGYLEALGLQSVEILDRAIGLSLVGFLVIAAGIRVAWGLIASPPVRTFEGRFEESRSYDIRRLFWLVAAIFLFNWFVDVGPGFLIPSAGQIVEKVLDFREVLLVMLLAIVLHRNDGYKYALGAFAVAIVPELASTQMDFKTLFFYVIVLLATEWRPGTTFRFLQIRNRRIVSATVLICTFILVSGVVWEGAIKPVWRWAGAEGNPITRVQTFLELSSEAVENFQVREGVDALVSRVESTGQFALVLRRVPQDLRHERGALLRRTVEHVTMPRVIFPDKPILNATELATKYAGLTIKQGTSVGIGYMAEFYVDFGEYGMFVPMFFYGLLIGGIYTLLARSTRTFELFSAGAIVIYIDHFTSYEGEFAKLVGGIIMSTIIFLLIVRFVEPSIQRMIQPHRDAEA
ncbi:MAG: hypothetical protein WD423_03530 [Rhodothermales bacterium]